MAVTIKIKTAASSGVTPTTALEYGELAINQYTGVLYYKHYDATTPTIKAIGSNATVAGAVLITGDQTIAGTKAFSQQLQLAAGTATIPGIAFTGDTNTGVYNSAADTLQLVTDGVSRLSIDSTGNVGIGTTTPTDLLSIFQSSLATTTLRIGNNLGNANNAAAIVFSAENLNEDGRIEVQRDGSNTAGIMKFFTKTNAGASTERLRIDAVGNVGIGTTTPGVSLEINSANQLRLKQSEAGGAYFDFISTSTGHGAGLGKFVITRNGGTTSTPPFAIDTSGNVGIGTTTPLTRLDVAGSGRFTGTASSTLTGTADPTASTTLVGTGTLFTTELVIGDRITINAETRTVTAIASATSLTVDTAFTDTASASITKLSAILLARLSSNAVGMVMNNLGNVGIGTSTPVALLTVGSTATTSSEMTLQGEYQSSVFNNSNTFNFRHGGADRWRLTTNQNATASNDFDFKINAINAAANGYNTFVTIKGLSGNVGIGNTAPGEKLQVAGSIKATGDLILDNNRTVFWGGSTEGITGSQSTNSLSLLTSGSTRVFVKSDGNVGIGTTGPVYKLDVTGTGRFTNTLTLAPAANLTASQPAIDITQTWYSSGVTFTGLKQNITDNASASGSLLLDLQTGGVSKFSVTKTGGIKSFPLARTVVLIGTFAQTANQVAYINLPASLFMGSVEIRIGGSWQNGAAYGSLRRRFNYYKHATDLLLAADYTTEVLDASGPVAINYAIGDLENYGTAKELRVPIYQVSSWTGNTLYAEIIVWAAHTSLTQSSVLIDGITVTAPATVSNSFTRNYVSFSEFVGIATTAPTSLLSIGGTANRVIGMERNITPNTAGSSLTLRASGATIGMVATANLTGATGGTGYAANNMLALATPNGGTASTITVITVDANGAILTFSITTKGALYTTGVKTTTVLLTNPVGVGTGATINVATIENATDKAGGNLLLTSGIGTGTLGSEIQFWTSPTGTTGATDNAVTQKMTILGNGNVGIGTTGPVYKLDVTGTGRFTSTLLVSGATTLSTTSIQGSASHDLPTYSAEFLLAITWVSTGWTGSFDPPGWTHTPSNTNTLSHDKVAVTGSKYQIAYTVTSRTAGSFTIAFGGDSLAGISATGAWGPTAVSTAALAITPTDTFNGTIVISIKSITATSTALVNLKSSDGTVRIEMRANAATSSANNNTFIGFEAGRYNTTGVNNIAYGYNAFAFNTTGFANTAIGRASLYNNTTGNYNTANGGNALYSNTTGYNNTAIGYNSLYYNTTGYYNTANGLNSLQNNTTGTSNTAIGYASLYYNTTGYNNTAIGYNSLQNNTTGYYNTANGLNSLYSNLTGYYNTANGYASLYSNLTGYNNTAYGYNAGRSLTTGNTNTFLGSDAGYHGSQSTSSVNSMALGNGAYTTLSNQVVIGNTSVTQTLLNGNVGIGTTAPAYTLDVTGTGRFTSTLLVSGALSAGVSTLYASSATSSSTSNSNWLRSPTGTVTAFIGDTDETHTYDVNAFSGNLRFNGSGVKWGDFGYYPMGGSSGTTNWGHFRFSLADGPVVTTPNAWVSAGVFIAATGFRVSNSAQTAANYLRSDGTNFISAPLAAADLTGTVVTARIAGSYTGITAVGTLTTLAVTGAATFSSTLAVTGAVDVTGTLSIGSVLKQRGVTQFNNSPLTTGASTVTRSVTQDQTVANGTNVLYFGYPTVTNIQVNVPSANYTTVTLSRSTLSAVTTATGNITFAKFIGSVSVSQAVASKTLNFGTGTSGTSGTPGVGTTALTIPLAAGQSLDATTPITGTNVPASTTITTALNSVGVIVMSADSTSTFITTTSGPITFGTPIVAAVSISQTGIATTLIFASSAISALYVGMYVSGTGISVAANNNTSGIAAGAYVYATGTSALVTNNLILADTIVLSVTSQNVTLSSRTSGLVTTGGGAITFITNFGTLFSAPVTANQTVTNTTRLSTAVVASSVNSSGQYIIEYVISASVASPVWSLLDYPTNTAVSGSGILAGSYAIAPASHTLISGTLYYARLTLNNALTADITVGSTLIFSTYQFNTLTFASATGLFQGAIVTGNNIPPNASIFSISSSTVTLSFDGGSTSTTSPLMGLAPTTTSGVITFATISMLGHTTISASVAETGTALVTDSTFLYGNPVSLYNNLNLLQRALGSKLLLSDVTGLVNGTVISNHANIAAGTTISFISTSGPGLGVTLSTPLLGTVPVSSVIWFGGSGVNNKTVRAEWPLNPIDQTDNRIIYLNNTDGLMVGTLMYGYTNGSYTGIVFNTNSDTTSAALNSSIWITAVVDHYSITLNVAPALGVSPTVAGWASTSVVGTTVTAVTLTSGSIISYQPRVAVTASIDINTVVPAGTTVTLLLSLTSSKNGTNGIYVNSRVFGTNIPYGTIVTSIIPNKSIVLSSPTPLSSTLDSSVVLTFTTATVAVERIDVSIARNSISWSPTSTNVYRYNSASVLASASSNDSGFVNRITTVWSNAYASAADRAIYPGFGGFTIALQSRPSHSYACYMKACIPIGYTVNFTGNSIGNLSTTTFVTDVIGTGRWEDYVVYLKTSSPSTTFSTTFYMFLVSSSAGSSTAGGWNPTPMSPLIWHVSSVQAYEMDNRRAKVTGSFGVTALTGSGNTGYIPRLSGSTTVLTNSPLLVNAANIASTLPIAVSSIGGASGGTLTVTTPLTLSSSLTVTGSGVNIGPISGASSGTAQLAIHSPHTGGFNNNSGYLMRADIKFGFEYTSIYGSNVFPSLFHSHITSTAASSGTVAILCGNTRMLTTAAGSGVYVTPSLFVGEANNSSYTRVYTATANATASSTVAFSSIVAPPIGSLINGVGITAGTTVTASSTTSVTLSAAHTGITASPYVISYALILTASAGASSQAVITFTAALGMPIYAGAHITGTGISAGTYILTTAQSISTTVTLSTNLTATASGTYTIVHARVFTGTAPTSTGIAGNIDWVSFIFGTTAGSVGTILHHGSPIFGTGIPPGTTLERSSDTTASSATIALTQKLTAAVTASTYVIINMLPAASITSAGAISGTSLVVTGATTINSSLTVAGTVANLGRYTTFSAGGVQTNSFNDNGAAVFPFVARNSYSGVGYGTGYGFALGYDGGQLVNGTSVAAGDIAVAQETAYTSTLSTQDSYMRFSTSLDGVVAEKMRITSAGNVGIGTATPTGKIDIQGSAIHDLPTYSAEFLSTNTWTSTVTADWTGSFAAGWTHTTGNTSVLSYTTAAVTTTKYQIAYTVTGRTAGSFTIAFGGDSLATSGTGAWGPTTSSTAPLTITPTTDFNGTIVISIKSITSASTALVILKSSDGTARIEIRANNPTAGNTFIGLGAGRYTTTGYQNTANGYQSLINNTTGYQNTANGYGSLYTNTTGYLNLANGAYSLYTNTTGYYNIAVGYSSLYYNTTGFSNNAVGLNALQSNLTGYYNIAIGQSALQANTTGYNNVACGHASLNVNTTGVGNTAIGYASLLSATNSSSNNTVVGANAGRTLTTSNYNTFLGNSAGYHGSQSLTASNSMALGNGTYTTADNQVVIGNTSVTQTLLNGNVGIGTASPTNILSLGNAAARKFWIENTATDVVGRALTVAAGGTIAGTSTSNVAGGNLILQSGLGTGTGASAIEFQTGTTLTTGLTLQTMSTKMTILGSGNVGIGTATPAYKLDVTGTGRFTDVLAVTSGLNVFGNLANSGFSVATLGLRSGGTTSATHIDYYLSLQNNASATGESNGLILYDSNGTNYRTYIDCRYNSNAPTIKFGDSNTAPGGGTLLAATFSGTVAVDGTITGSSTVQGTRLISTIATGTAPLTVTSTTAVTNLNADLLDDQEGAYYRDATNLNAGTVATARLAGSYGSITAVGTLTTLTVTNAITAKNLTLSGTATNTFATATGFIVAPGPVSALSINTIGYVSTGTNSYINEGSITAKSYVGSKAIVSPTISSNAASAPLDLSLGNTFVVYLPGSSLSYNLTYTFTNPSNPPPIGSSQSNIGAVSSFSVVIVEGTTAATGVTHTWPAEVHWPGGVMPAGVTGASKSNVYNFIGYNSTATPATKQWIGNLFAGNLSSANL